MILQYPAYKTETIQCPHCKWQGKGRELKNDEYHPESNILDLDCPACYQHVGFVQFPIDEGKSYNKDEDKKYW